jgi:hypothetical protein
MPKRAHSPPTQAKVLTNSLTPVPSTPYINLQEDLHDLEQKVKQLNTFLSTPKLVDKLTVAEHKLLKKLRTEYGSVVSLLKQFTSTSL